MTNPSLIKSSCCAKVAVACFDGRSPEAVDCRGWVAELRYKDLPTKMWSHGSVKLSWSPMKGLSVVRSRRTSNPGYIF